MLAISYATRMLRQLSILLLVVSLAACSSFGKEADPTRDWSPRRLYNSAKSALDSAEFETAIEFYQKLESRFPFGQYAQQAQMEIVYAYYRFDEPASAIAAADRFIKLHPTHPNVDYVYYIKGLTSFNEGKGIVDRFIPRDDSSRDPGAARASFKVFARLVERFPNSRYAEDSSKRLLYLRNNLSRHEINVAEYYMRRGAYVAAVNRARYVVENYQQTPAMPDALVLMAKAYKLLKLDDLSADALRVLKLNYPEHEGIAEVSGLVVK